MSHKILVVRILQVCLRGCWKITQSLIRSNYSRQYFFSLQTSEILSIPNNYTAPSFGHGLFEARILVLNGPYKVERFQF